MHRRQRHQPREAVDRDRAGRGHAPEVVAQKVHDHEVLGARPWPSRASSVASRASSSGVGAAPPRALDRPRLDGPRPHAQERLRRVAQDRRARRRQVGAERRRRQRAQPQIDRQRVVLAERRVQPVRQVHLIAVAGAQILEHARRRGGDIRRRSSTSAARPATASASGGGVRASRSSSACAAAPSSASTSHWPL